MERIKRIQGDSVHLISVNGDKPLKLSQISTGGGGGTRPHYTGDYIVTPLVNNQVILETQGKLMDDDVTVLRVPYLETSNPSGGNTAYIGEYVNG